MKEYNINELVPFVERVTEGKGKIRISPLEITIDDNHPMGPEIKGRIQFLIPQDIVQVTAATHYYDKMMKSIATAIEAGTDYEVIYVNPVTPKEIERKSGWHDL